MTSGHARPEGSGLAGLRRRAEVTELLFLFECTTAPPTQLRPIAERLGITVQAASHAYRALARRDLVEVRDGHYRTTVGGVAWLHTRLDALQEDLGRRIDRLHVIRSARAVAGGDLRAHDVVRLQVRDGWLTALPGRGGSSRGRAAHAARRGALVEVVDLEGIVPIRRGTVSVVVVDGRRTEDGRLVPRLRASLRGSGLVAAVGLEAAHLLERVTEAPVLRYGVGSAVIEASRLGTDTTVVVVDTLLPRFLEQLGAPDPPPIHVATLAGGAPRALRRRAARSR